MFLVWSLAVRLTGFDTLSASVYFSIASDLAHRRSQRMSNVALLQTEISSKLDFIWTRKFGVEKEEVETMASVNKVLLENILPAHVAEHFLSSQHRQEVCSVDTLVLYISHLTYSTYALDLRSSCVQN